MNTKKLSFAAIYRWIDKNSMWVTYGSQVDLFECIYNHYIAAEGVHYSAGRISQIFRGNVCLPKEIVRRYQLKEAYVASLETAIKDLLTQDFVDAPASLAELRDMIEGDETLSDIQKRNLLRRADFEGEDASAAWVTDVVRFAMLRCRDTSPKIT